MFEWMKSRESMLISVKLSCVSATLVRVDEWWFHSYYRMIVDTPTGVESISPLSFGQGLAMFLILDEIEEIDNNLRASLEKLNINVCTCGEICTCGDNPE